MRRRFQVEIVVEFDVKPDYPLRDAARFVESVLTDRFESDDGGDRLLDITVCEVTGDAKRGN
jgi:hypothetical protein